MLYFFSARLYSTVMGLIGLGTKYHCALESQQQLAVSQSVSHTDRAIHRNTDSYPRLRVGPTCETRTRLGGKKILIRDLDDT
jgi:hypothetical protein